MTTFQGARIKDCTYPENPGDYSKCHSIRDGVESTVWFIKVPTGGSVLVIGRPNIDGSPHHYVEENDDGTITVRPHPPGDPDNSNSILWAGWHGYIVNGVWTTNLDGLV